jgi:hypothetical protein
MRPRVVAKRITAVLAAYALVVATAILPLSGSASHAVDVECLAGGVSPSPMPDNAPDTGHVTCGLCVAGCSVVPLCGGAEQAQLDQTSAPLLQQNPEQTPPSRARVGPGLPRAPPQSA